uniref:uncharacterized protein LOC127071948 isoform X2 n=1 Tax=Vespula vulgaris TaxID=7454 RepID=UPI002129B3C8|nr:uncharacterized protein LOC127071948 isoform X2 [Vespula vulgaris]
MNSFDNYDRTNLSEVCSSVMNLNDENENNDHFLWNMDTPVNKKDSSIYNSYEPKRKRCSLGEKEDIDGTGWCGKPIKSWCQEETISWLMSAASSIGLPYRSIQQSLAVSGEQLAMMTRNDFLFHDPIYGDKLYCHLHSQRISNSLPPFEAIHSHSEDDLAQMSSSGVSDTESDNCMKITMKRPPGRPKMLKPKKNGTITKVKYFNPYLVEDWFISSALTQKDGKLTILTSDIDIITHIELILISRI